MIKNKNNLSSLEELKIKRFAHLLKFLNKTKVVYFAVHGPILYDLKTESFYDNITKKTIKLDNRIVDIFYSNLCRDAKTKLESSSSRTKIKCLQKILMRLNKIRFLQKNYGQQ